MKNMNPSDKSCVCVCVSLLCVAERRWRPGGDDDGDGHGRFHLRGARQDAQPQQPQPFRTDYGGPLSRSLRLS